jgi:hypothetical protein
MDIEVAHRLDLQVEFIKEEIFVKIESIKEELNMLGTNLVESLNQAKIYFQRYSDIYFQNIYFPLDFIKYD